MIDEADRIAADFSTIPFPDHEARTLALAYFRLKAERDEARALLLDIEGTVIAYWTDIPESELERIRLRIADIDLNRDTRP